MTNSGFTVKARGPLWTLISFTPSDSWAKTQAPDRIVKIAALQGGYIFHIKVKGFRGRVGP